MVDDLSEGHVSLIDWIVVGLSGATFLACLAGATYVGWYGGSAARHAGSSFNYLGRARLCFQLAAASYAAAQVLRLQVLWGPQSVFGDPSGRWQSTAMCRVYIAVEYGLCEPVVMLLALFACVYSVQSKLAPPVVTGGVVWEPQPLSLGPPGTAPTRPGVVGSARPGSIRHPNFNIVFFALGFTLPACAAQLMCALFTRIFDLDYQDVPLFRVMFAAYDQRQTAHCPPDTANPNTSCAWCVFPVLSTLISGGFLAAFLLALWVVTGRIAQAAISKIIIKRIRILQLVVTVSLVGSLACRGATAYFEPFNLGFELLRLAHVLLFSVALLSMSHLLIWRPVRDAQLADKHLAAAGITGGMAGAGDACGGGAGQGQGSGEGAAATGVVAGPGGMFWQSPAAAGVVAGVGAGGGDGGGAGGGGGSMVGLGSLSLSGSRVGDGSGSMRSATTGAQQPSITSGFSGIIAGAGGGGGGSTGDVGGRGVGTGGGGGGAGGGGVRGGFRGRPSRRTTSTATV